MMAAGLVKEGRRGSVLQERSAAQCSAAVQSGGQAACIASSAPASRERPSKSSPLLVTRRVAIHSFSTAMGPTADRELQNPLCCSIPVARASLQWAVGDVQGEFLMWILDFSLSFFLEVTSSEYTL